MNDRHYLLSNGKVSGPFAQAHLQRLAQRGILKPADEISPDRRTWQPAENWPELFRSPHSTSTPVGTAVGPSKPRSAIEKASVEPSKTKIIGRDSDCDFVLDNLAVASRHLSLTTTHAGVTAQDLGSSSGTFVNGSRLDAPRLLFQGDTLSLGGVTLMFNGRSVVRPPEDLGFLIRISGLGREVVDRASRKPRMLIRECSMTIRPGEFVALVGASGAGKSTLFGALSGRVRATHGQVLFDGADLYANFESLRGSIGYVPQRDVFHDVLPVADALRATSRLRLSTDTSDMEIDANIDRVLKIVSLTERRDTVISNLSGGEQKRVAISMELLSRPRVLFLDEPTAPLDPRTNGQMMRLFRELADSGITVIMITHAAGSLIVCDVVAYMHKGLLTFQGSPEQMLAFFSVKSMGEAYAVEERQSPQQWRDAFERTPACQQFTADRGLQPPAPPAPPSMRNAGGTRRAGAGRGTLWNQTKVLTGRGIKVLTLERRNLIMLLALAPVVAVMLCLVTSSIDTSSKVDPFSAYVNYYTKQKILSFGSVMVVMFLALFASVREIVKELPIYLHEHFVTVEVIPYLLSKIVVLVCIDLLQVAMVVAVINLYGGMEAGKPPLQFGVLFMCSLVGTMLGLMISAMVSQSDHAVTGMIIVVIPEILFASALIPVKGLAKFIAAPLITTYWGLNALMSRLPAAPINTAGLNEQFRQQYEEALPSSLVMLGQLIAIAGITYWMMIRKDGPGASERIAAQLTRKLTGGKQRGK